MSLIEKFKKWVPVKIRELRPVWRPRADATLTGSEAIYAAVSRISSTIAMTPLHLYRGMEIQEDHPLERLVSIEPNPNMSGYIFRQTVEAFRNTEGNAYILINRDGLTGPIRQLDILNPAYVTPDTDPQTGEVWYHITLDDGKRYPLPGSMIIKLQHLSASEKGIRPIDVLKSTLDYDAQVKALNLERLDGVNQGLMLTIPTSVNSTRSQEIVSNFLSNYEKSNRRVVVLEGGMTATTFSGSSIDSGLLDVDRITRNKVAAVYNLPPHMLGDYTASAGDSEQQMMEYLQMTIMPIYAQWEQEFNRKLLSPMEYAQGYRFRFQHDELIRANVGTMAEKYTKGIRGGWMTPNEVREREGLKPFDIGDQLIVSRDLIPFEIVVNHPEMLLSSARAPGGGSGDDSQDTGKSS